MEPDARNPARVAFGRFLLLPHRRELLADGEPVRLGARAFDVLMVLIEARGATVGKDALAARVWPGQIVLDTALQSQISALRAALGADRDLIRTVSGRGYQFVGDIRDDAARVADMANPGGARPLPHASVPPVPTNLSERVSELIGRDKELDEVVDLAASHRLVTLTGAGGIGKTRLAIEAARRLMTRFGDGVWIVDFSALSDASLIPGAIAMAVGLETDGTATRQHVARTIAARPLLLVLDTCEHVVGAVAAMAEELLRAGTAVHVIATSREPLRAEGEWIYPVLPLAVPAEDAVDEDPSRYGAVRLFIERARAVNPHFAPDPRDAAAIVAICRRLDGIPLAIELAAAQTTAFSVEQLVAHLHDRFDLLTAGRRTALPRHQTLRATLDWSHDLLTEPERVVLRRLEIFAGAFSLEAIGAIVANPPELARWAAIEALSSLVAKSLVVADVGSSSMPYRLLDTTRAFALEKLDASGERTTLARRHAEYYRDLFEQAEAESDAKPAAEWGAEYGRAIGNLRAALDWALSTAGEPSIGMALTAAAVPLWMHLSLVDECRRRVEQALAVLQSGADHDVRQEMKLQAARARTALYTGTGGVADVGAAWTAALELAEKLEDTEYQLRSLRGLWFFHNMSGRHGPALAAAERFCALAAKQPDPNEQIIGERMIGVSHYYKGEYASARRHLEHVLATYVDQPNRAHIIRFEYHPLVTARTTLARILWLQGFPDQGMRTAETAVEDARATQNVISLLYAWVQAACPVALWVGDLHVAERYVRTLVDQSTEHGLALGQAFGRCYEGMLVIGRGESSSGARLLLDGVETFGKARSEGLRLIAFMVADALGRAGHIAEGLGVVEEVIVSSAENEDRWHMAELLRVRGELLLLRDKPGNAADDFRQALEWARRQGALAWELRAAMSLGRLLRDEGRSAEAVALLQPVYDRFTEGFETFDLKAAANLLGVLRNPEQ
jgi:predicted ATPase/DNA-binding winged helix-turn-helix (wHTH) protein